MDKRCFRRHVLWNELFVHFDHPLNLHLSSGLPSLFCGKSKVRSIYLFRRGPQINFLLLFFKRAWKNVLFREKIKILISLQKGTLAVPNTTRKIGKYRNSLLKIKWNTHGMQHLDPIWALLITYYYITYRMKTWGLLALSPTFHPHFVAQIPASVFDTQSALHYLRSRLPWGHMHVVCKSWPSTSFFLPIRYNLAGFLINIVFSSLFLGTQIPNVAVIWKQAGPQLMYGMLIAWGQWVVALVVTGALLVRTAYSPDSRHYISPYNYLHTCTFWI